MQQPKQPPKQQPPRRCVVSVEALAVPGRAAILKSLHDRLGLPLIEADAAPAHPFRKLLARMQALARLDDKASALWSGSCVLDVPRDEEWRSLYQDLGQELADRLLVDPQRITHLMLVLDADVDEAFEALFASETSSSQPARETCLQHLRQGRELLCASAGAVAASPFVTRIVTLECPAFAADNHVALADLCHRACQEYLKVAAEPVQ